MRGIVFNLLNERLRKSRETDGWDWLVDDEEDDMDEIQVSSDLVLMPLARAIHAADALYWPPIDDVPIGRKPN